MSCRICDSNATEVLDLGAMPPANSLKHSPDEPQDAYPLVLEWCEACDNVQLRDTLSADVLYRDYLYVTPDSAMLEAHYAFLLDYLLTNGFLASHSFVVEAGSNAGHFLRHVRASVGRVLGVDPAVRIATIANDAGTPTIVDYFNRQTAERILEREGAADLVVARHCMAHNETPHEMMDAARLLLNESGYLVIENAYVLNTIENTEFDQVYHEHMFYFSIRSMKALLNRHDMRLVDVMMSLVHGGSIIFVAAKGTHGSEAEAVHRYQSREENFLNATAFRRFGDRARQIRSQVLDLVAELNDQSVEIYTYGATAKGNTLLNFMGITRDQIPFCVDSTPMKQGLFLPMSNIKVISEKAAAVEPPAYYLLTAWNYQDEIIGKVRGAGNYTSKFIVPIPFVKII